jgi:predicted RNase H-like nuclease (RuvC/YqgF family)
MLKYVSGILKTISPTQRLIALCILVLAIVIMTVGPRLADSFTKDNEELKSKVALQKTEIAELTTRVNELNTQVISNQRECTNSLIAKEKEILDIVVEIEKHATQSRILKYEQGRTINPAPTSTNPKMLSKLKALKTKLQVDLDKQPK